MRRTRSALGCFFFVFVIVDAGCKKPPLPNPAETEEADSPTENAQPAFPAGPLPLVIAEGSPPEIVISMNGRPVNDGILGNGSVEEVREGGLTLSIAGARIDVAMRVSPEPSPPFVRGELVSLDYKPLPPPTAKSVDVMLRRGKGETARTIQFLRLRMMMPVMRYLADGQVGLEQVGSPHSAKEGDGKTPYGLDVAVTVAGKRALAHAGDVVPLSLREGAVDLTIVSSLLRGGSVTMTGNVPPYHLVAVLAPSPRPPDLYHPAGPNAQPLTLKR